MSSIEFYSYFNVLRIDIVYEAGHLDANLIPAQIKHGIAHHVAIAYKNREAENSNSLSIVKEIYSPFRELQLFCDMNSVPKMLSELHKIALKLLKEDSNIKSCIAGIYDYPPKNPALPYISMRITNYQEISLIPKLMLRAKLVLGIYSFSTQSLFEIMESTSKALSALNLRHPNYKAVLLNNGTAGQHDDVLYALMNFNVLLKEKCDDRPRT